MPAECFTGKTLDAIPFVRAPHMALGYSQPHAGMTEFILARKNNNPVAGNAYGVGKYALEFRRLEQSRCFGKVFFHACASVRPSDGIRQTGAYDPWRDGR